MLMCSFAAYDYCILLENRVLKRPMQNSFIAMAIPGYPTRMVNGPHQCTIRDLTIPLVHCPLLNTRLKNHAQLVLRGIYRKRVLQALRGNESFAMIEGTGISAEKIEYQYNRRTSGTFRYIYTIYVCVCVYTRGLGQIEYQNVSSVQGLQHHSKVEVV